MFLGPFNYSIIKRAKEKKLVEIEFVNIRDFGIGKHKIVDDKPYGGGVGMLMRVDVLEKAIKHARCPSKKICKERTILLDPQGKIFGQKKALELSRLNHLILVCGHYEGVDERVKKLVDEEISIGDYILTGGEIPAMVVTDAVIRLIPNVLEKKQAGLKESFLPLLEYPQYTRPRVFKGSKVPDILLSGNHKKIKEWQEKEVIKRTRKRRPDLFTQKGDFERIAED